ncbi:hypothetical protein CFC21_084819 [Triticum aestivum]|uniref:Uncharacterized protein n=2 Tax=Triticum aestivum TaxID=4565 RepID=A0A9R1ICI2_WHEAT|nr:hypothetical protein CFC21_084819 [Triticum aestivum]
MSPQGAGDPVVGVPNRGAAQSCYWAMSPGAALCCSPAAPSGPASVTYVVLTVGFSVDHDSNVEHELMRLGG